MSTQLKLTIWMLMYYNQRAMCAWTISNTMARSDDAMVVGVYNGSIWLLGGRRFERQMTEYKVSSKQFIDYGRTALTITIPRGAGQYWTQQHHIIYMINNEIPSQFNTYNMETHEYTTNWNAIAFDTDTYDTSCLASSELYLFVTGGGGTSSTLNTLQILTLSTHQWLRNAPPMNQIRGRHACIAHNGYLWVFGGTQQTNERILTTDITQNSWNLIDSLTMTLRGPSSVPFHHQIYVIGGQTAHGGSNNVDIVHVVDADTGSVTVLPDAMHRGTAYSSPIIVRNMLYVFGGFWSDRRNAYTRDYAYYPLETAAPTLPTAPSPASFPSTSQIHPTLSMEPSSATATTRYIIYTCGDTLDGVLNGDAIQFEVDMPYEGSLEVDASRSDSLTISSLTAILGITPIATDYDRNGVWTVQDAVPGIYIFTLLSNSASDQMYSIQISCTDIISSTLEANGNIHFYQTSQSPLLLLLLLGAGGALLIVFCVLAIIRMAPKMRPYAVDIEMSKHVGGAQNHEPQSLYQWFTEMVGLPQYFNTFMENGYNSLTAVKRIQNKEELIAMGITKTAHVYSLMSFIADLRNEEGIEVRCNNKFIASDFNSTTIYNTQAILQICDSGTTSLRHHIGEGGSDDQLNSDMLDGPVAKTEDEITDTLR